MTKFSYRSGSIAAAICAAAIALPASRASAAPACAAGTTVQTDKGAVCGIVVNGINSWQGIPHSAPPVGNLRWAPPQPAAAWSGTLNATAFASRCTQASGGSEDCLYLNVWAPPGAHGLAVMAHIHGGGFRGGSGAGDYSLLSSTGSVVVVTIAGDMTTSGSADGVGGAARFNAAFGITRDSRNGTLYVADQGNFAIRKVTPP